MDQETTADDTATDSGTATETDTGDRSIGPDGGVVEELLIEEISIDGMCGVY